jgi:hypothetical protein
MEKTAMLENRARRAHVSDLKEVLVNYHTAESIVFVVVCVLDDVVSVS